MSDAAPAPGWHILTSGRATPLSSDAHAVARSSWSANTGIATGPTLSAETLGMILEMYTEGFWDGKTTDIKVVPLLQSCSQIRDILLCYIYRSIRLESNRAGRLLTNFLTKPHPSSYFFIKTLNLTQMSYSIGSGMLVKLRKKMKSRIGRFMRHKEHPRWVMKEHGEGGESGFIIGCDIKTSGTRGFGQQFLSELSHIFYVPKATDSINTLDSQPGARIFPLLTSALTLIVSSDSYHGRRYANALGLKQSRTARTYPTVTSIDYQIRDWPERERGGFALFFVLQQPREEVVQSNAYANLRVIMHLLESLPRLERLTISIPTHHLVCAEGTHSHHSEKIVLKGCEPGECPSQGKPKHQFADLVVKIFRGVDKKTKKLLDECFEGELTDVSDDE